MHKVIEGKKVKVLILGAKKFGSDDQYRAFTICTEADLDRAIAYFAIFVLAAIVTAVVNLK